MVLTLTGVITSPEPGLGARGRAAVGCPDAGTAVLAPAGGAVSSTSDAPEGAASGAMASARAKRCSNGVFGCSTTALGSVTAFTGSIALAVATAASPLSVILATV